LQVTPDPVCHRRSVVGQHPGAWTAARYGDCQ
jgi:hypothetical protein